MSKYNRGPYHFMDYADPNSEYHAHVQDLLEQVGKVTEVLPRVESLPGLVEPGLLLHEVGCGEGLLLHLMPWHARCFLNCTGNDADAKAVTMGKLLVRNAAIHHEWDWPKKHPNRAYDIVMFCDSLEHIANWQEHVEWAARAANCVVIAVPSKPDKHATHKALTGSSFDHYFGGWEAVHRRTRHARHLVIWVRKR